MLSGVTKIWWLFIAHKEFAESSIIRLLAVESKRKAEWCHYCVER